jgi:hypothetical protein
MRSMAHIVGSFFLMTYWHMTQRLNKEGKKLVINSAANGRK